MPKEVIFNPIYTRKTRLLRAKGTFFSNDLFAADPLCNRRFIFQYSQQKKHAVMAY